MMKNHFLLLLLGLLPTILLAQNPKGRFSVTPMAGINVTGFGGATLDAYKYKVRLTAGAETEYAVNDWLGLSLGSFYSQQGANIDWGAAALVTDEQGVEHITGINMDGKLHCDYLNFPLLANIYIPQIKGLAIKIGLQMGVLVNDKMELETLTAEVASLSSQDFGVISPNEQNQRISKVNMSVSNVCNSIDFGIPVGLSYEYRNVTLNARYYFGLRRVDKTTDPDEARNRYLSVTLGYRFHL